MGRVASFGTICLVLVLLTGCTREESFEQHFNETMKEQGSPHSLIHQELDVVNRDDAVAIYRQEDKIWISYFEKIENKWSHQEGHGLNCGTPVNWTSTNGHIFSGLICNNDISKVYVNNNTAKFITIENEKKFWYIVTSKQQDIEEVEVKFVKKDGSEDIVENYESKY
ncbi:hypothetical protein [Halobacillus naozhouensis]|uniref:Lipoprotein n=1 Tax=Halobacillus naozhouensis TaxID=554880 RepID=A0ABY8IV61_9BACI|nr:hypothetical protein [Halobacillus naozhouensis]WFT74054.1 hypothetical protein P9989_17015 [Halobacillus naozhouensis]